MILLRRSGENAGSADLEPFSCLYSDVTIFGFPSAAWTPTCYIFTSQLSLSNARQYWFLLPFSFFSVVDMMEWLQCYCYCSRSTPSKTYTVLFSKKFDVENTDPSSYFDMSYCQTGSVIKTLSGAMRVLAWVLKVVHFRPISSVCRLWKSEEEMRRYGCRDDKDAYIMLRSVTCRSWQKILYTKEVEYRKSF